ncbi:hypothetical protein PM082_016340 [Marasmius tenuissimus]|nr:hypothetical protein PM082_016340 [Marasmius tenuissimus]
MSSQKALFITKKQGPFAIDTRDIQTPGAGEILVEIKAAALNPVDWKIQKYGFFLQNYPALYGYRWGCRETRRRCRGLQCW